MKLWSRDPGIAPAQHRRIEALRIDGGWPSPA